MDGIEEKRDRDGEREKEKDVQEDKGGSREYKATTVRCERGQGGKIGIRKLVEPDNRGKLGRLRSSSKTSF